MKALELLTETQAAEYISMSVHYLRKDRSSGVTGGRTPGPRYMKLGTSIRYRVGDLDEWLSSHVAPTHAERIAAVKTGRKR